MKVLQLLCFDLIGIMRFFLLNGLQYYAIFNDNFLKKSWMFFMCAK